MAAFCGVERAATLVLLLVCLQVAAAAAAEPVCYPSRCPAQCLTTPRKRSGSTPPQTRVSDYVLFSGSTLNNLSLPAVTHNSTVNVFGTTVFVFRIDNPLHHVTFAPPGNDGCPGLFTTSETATAAGCQIAVNAGFFNRGSGDCVGNVIDHGRLVQISGIENVNFAILKNGSFLIGYLTQSDVWQNSFQFSELISGMLWILREGKPYYCESYGIERPSKDFLDSLAARTLIGHDSQGRLFLIAVQRTGAQGISIYQLSELALSLGLWNAVNLDGGGSTTVFQNGKILNAVTDRCLPGQIPIIGDRCERPLTTIVCVK